MKMTTILLILTLLSFSSCTPTNTNSSGTSSSDTGGDTGGDTGTDGDDVDTSGTDGTDDQDTVNVPSNCTGETSDGEGSGLPIHQLRLVMAGHQAWLPGASLPENSLPEATISTLRAASMPTLQAGAIIFQSDSRLKVRFKINSQPYPTVGEEYCSGRKTGKASDPFRYNKLKFKMHLRDIECETVNAQDPTTCDSELKIGVRYATQYIGPIQVQLCSSPIDIGPKRNRNNPFGTVIEIEDVKADSTCQANETFCPAEQIVRAASCWDMTLQVSTDYTQDFKP